MSVNEHEILASGVLSEAVVFFGLTTSELVAIILMSLSFWAPVLLLIGVVFFGNVLFSVGFILILTLVTAVVAGKRMQSIKRGKPDGHYKQMINIKLAKTKLVGSKFILADGPMRLGRTEKVIREVHLG